MSDDDVAQQVRADRIDILVDLAGHTAHNRLLVFARKPAPVQVTYLAYCSTTGLSAMDYRISDPYLDPVGGGEEWYSEKTVRIPSYWCYQAPVGAPMPAELPSASRDFITFGCLNNFSKVSKPALETWGQILRQVPGSRLRLHGPPGNTRERTKDLFASMGVERERISFANMVPFDEYLTQYGDFDIALDPFPYAGGTTTCDALYMGVPVVTLRGKTAVGRGGASILSNIGLQDLIAETPEQYVQIATTLAGDKARLMALRGSIRGMMQGSPLMDPVAFTRSMEAAYMDMCNAWMAKK